MKLKIYQNDNYICKYLYILYLYLLVIYIDDNLILICVIYI